MSRSFKKGCVGLEPISLDDAKALLQSLTRMTVEKLIHANFINACSLQHRNVRRKIRFRRECDKPLLKWMMMAQDVTIEEFQNYMLSVGYHQFARCHRARQRT